MTLKSNNEIFEDFCNTHYRYVSFFISKKFNIPKEDVLDMTQDVLLYMGTKVDKFEGRSTFKTWASSVILNFCRNKFKYNNTLKRRHYNINADISDLIDHSGREDSKLLYGLSLGIDFTDRKTMTPEEACSYNTTIDKVHECLSHINNKHAEIFRLRVFDNMNYKEISKQLGIHPVTVKTGYNRAKKQIAARLTKIKYVQV